MPGSGRDSGQRGDEQGDHRESGRPESALRNGCRPHPGSTDGWLVTLRGVRYASLLWC